MTKTLRAVLMPDGGEAAGSADYFRSPHHLRAEGVTHTLVIDGGGRGSVRLPLIVRPIEGTPHGDAVSPYGYPGGLLWGLSEVPKEAVDWAATGLVSIFVRDRVRGPRCFAGATERNEVFFIDPRLPIEFREMHQRHARRNAREGFVSAYELAREASAEAREGFKQAYRQTMVRDQAHARYFFSDAYFEELFSSPAAWLLTTRAPDGQVAAAAVCVISDEVFHYYLGGTADAYRARSPAKNLFVAMAELCTKLGLPLHLGGGMQPGDGLEAFKRGLANSSSRLYTHEIVCQPEVYMQLTGGRADSGYFPAYRAAPAQALTDAQP
ncbi:GNAT family N-acetyltransferase [Pyxidicoccus fallax]|uniref:GNAT family N-acetyltransferase n=1 Tax=Pyxidicoccus fallax TaxID=394095 RepID=A0A848LHW5_9BACT|nr:GNAT family N-acetyltransferase [Pyxidicoccus fallax]NMO16598.1 GNAT family N-acetyltransferase [Pyxidicoccus fallax]NPC78379.1 GNAT family N-acetyltransferase [Pyxidicoccus fallax]